MMSYVYYTIQYPILYRRRLGSNDTVCLHTPIELQQYGSNCISTHQALSRGSLLANMKMAKFHINKQNQTWLKLFLEKRIRYFEFVQK